MAAENEGILVKFGVKLDDLFKGLNEAQSAVKSQADAMKGHMEGLMHGVEMASKAFGMLAAIAGGGKMFGEAIAATQRITSEAKQMGKMMGQTTSEASIFIQALDNIGATGDQASTEMTMLTRTLGTAPEKFEQLGVNVRDANGEMRPMAEIMLDVNKKFGEMADGTGKNLAMAQMFGRRWMDMGAALKLTSGDIEKAKEEAEALNLVVGEENERDTKAFKISMNGMKDVMEGIEKTIGEAVMPMLTELGQWFAELGPAAVQFTKIAIGDVMGMFQGLKFVIYALWQVFEGFVQFFAIGMATIVEVMNRALHGDFAGAKAAWQTGWDQIKDLTVEHLNKINDEALKTASNITQLFSPQTKTKVKGGAEAPVLGKEKKEPKDKAEKSQMSVWEAENNAARETYEIEHNLRQRGLEEDVAFWKEKANNSKNSADDRQKAEAKALAAETALLKKFKGEQQALDQQGIAAAEKESLDGLALKKTLYDEQLSMGAISKDQMLELDRKMEEQRFAIMVAAQKARQQLAEDDPNSSPAALQKERDKMLEIERQHQLKVAELKKAQVLENAKYQMDFFANLNSGLNKVINDMLIGTAKLKDIFKNTFAAIGQALATTAAKMASDWIMNQLKMKVASAQTNMVEIKNSAGAAAASAYKAVAGIPYVGPAMAPVAAGVAYAGVMAYGVMSAQGGYDIPAGMNPVTQLHEKEMVLPREQADVIRGMAQNGGGGGGITLNVHATDAQSVARLFKDNGEHIVNALKNQRRNLNMAM